MNPVIVWVLNFMACSLFWSALRFFPNMTLVFVKLHCHNTSVMSLLTQIELANQTGSSANLEDRKEKANECKSCEKRIPASKDEQVSGDDAKIVMEELGMWSSNEGDGSCCDGKCTDSMFTDGALLMLEEKEASLEELEAAFTVFDENGDGFINPEEVQSVMQRLGLEEGVRLEDCERMIRAYDEDGDGMIGFKEFKNMLELSL